MPSRSARIDALVPQMVARYKAEQSTIEIARALGVSLSSVQSRLTEQGVRMRKKGWSKEASLQGVQARVNGTGYAVVGSPVVDAATSDWLTKAWR